MSSTSTEVPTAPSRADLQSAVDGPRGWVRDLVREILDRDLFAPVYELSPEAHRERVLTQVRTLVDEGGTALGFPEEFGGADDVGGSVTAFETLAFGDLSLLVKCGVQFGLYGGAILHLGTRHHHERYLPGAVTMETPGCFAMTETGHGSNVQAVGTTATYDPDDGTFVVHTPDASSRKDYIGNAARDGRMAVVFAQLIAGGQARGVHALIVPIRDEDGSPCAGVTIEDCGHKVGLNGVDNGRLSFDHVRIPREALLDRFASVAPDGTYTSPIENPNRRFFTMIGTLIQGRISVSGAAISAAKTALTIAIRYGDQRRQFGPPDSDEEVPVLDFLAHQRRLLPALARTYALGFAQVELVDGLHAVFTRESEAGGDRSEEDEGERRRLEARAAGTKAASTWHATRTIQTCREACGGAGYLSENRLGTLKADTDVFTTFEGDNTVLLQLVAKSLLTGYRDDFGDLDPLGTVRFVAEQVVDTVIERTAARQLVQSLVDAVPGREEETDLRDRGYHLALFEFREKHVLDTLARRFRSGIEGGEEPFAVFNACQDHLLRAAEVHVERLVLEAFVAAIERCDDDATTAMLERLCDLYALSEIERDRAWFLEHGRLSATRAKGVIQAVNDLCAELRPHARLLVDAFGVPESSIAAPIAT